MAEQMNIEEVENWRPKVLVIGAVVGAVVGLGAAYLFAQTAEKAGNRPTMKPADGVRLGLLVLGLLRQVAALGDE